MKYDEFVNRYCEGMTPNGLQKRAIEAWLDYPHGQIIWLSGRRSGKNTLRGWFQQALDDERKRLAAPFEPPPGAQQFTHDLGAFINEVEAHHLALAGDNQEAIDQIKSVMNERRRQLGYACPQCGSVSHNAQDVEEGYCGRCHAFTRG